MKTYDSLITKVTNHDNNFQNTELFTSVSGSGHSKIAGPYFSQAHFPSCTFP